MTTIKTFGREWVEMNNGWEDYSYDYPTWTLAMESAPKEAEHLNQPISVVYRVDGHGQRVYHLYTQVRPGSRVDAPMAD